MSDKVTREEMLGWLRDKQLEADDLQDGHAFDMVVAIRTLIKHGPEVSKGWIWRHLNKWNEFYGFIPITMNDLIIMITEAGVTVKEGE